MTEEVKTRAEVVEVGDTLATFSERHGVDAKDVIKHNETALREHAAARGFDHTFQRTSKDENDKVTTSVDYHVFAGEALLVPDTETKESKKNSEETVNKQELGNEDE